MNVLSGGMYDFVNDVLPNVSGNYFEIGVFNGTGFAEMARQHPDKICYALDPFIEDGHTVSVSGKKTGNQMPEQKQNYIINTENLTNTVLFEVTSKDYLDMLTAAAVKELDVAVVVIDGAHHYENVVIDFELATKLLGNREGVVVVDDTNVPGVEQAYNEFVAAHGDRISLDIPTTGSTRVLMLKQL